MSDQAEVKCGICLRAPRGGDTMTHPIRVTAEDFAAADADLRKLTEGEDKPHKTEPGLYQACRECKKALHPHMQKRLAEHYRGMNDAHEAANPKHPNARPYPEVPERIGGNAMM